MSRIGKLPIQVPDGVDVAVNGLTVTVKGPKGTLTQQLTGNVKLEREEKTLRCVPTSEKKEAREQWGLYRVLVSNMVTGVSQGFTKRLEIVGVGYRAEMKGKDLNVMVGYSHPVLVTPPEHISFAVEGPTKIVVSGIDKQAVGQVAANIRSIRPPEPYKGKGIRYEGEHIIRKAGKASAK